MYKFNNVSGLDTFLLESLGVDLLLPSGSNDQVIFFHDGDKLTVNLTTGELCWEPIEPGKMSTSKLSLRFHQWWGKGLISKVE